MSADEDSILTDDHGEADAPAVVLPGAGISQTQGLGLGGTVAGAVVSPQPLVLQDDSGGSQGLTERIEHALAEDGRFRSLLTSLTFSADDAGNVTLTGSLREALMKPSLLATIHAIPGVSSVVDQTD